MNPDFYEKLREEGSISQISLDKIKATALNPLFSLHWEIKTLLYLGVMLLSSGLGTLIYKNTDTIGHQAILAFIAAISAACFFYCFKHKQPFSKNQVKSPGSLFDYVLLLGCLSFLSFLGYIQAQYNVFGDNYGLATFIPTVALFYIAYDFDHIGILSLAITNLALWMGVSITPMQLIEHGDFDSIRIVLTYLALGLLLIAAAHLSAHYQLKKHFRFSYLHFGVHLSLFSLLAGYFYQYEMLGAVVWPLGVFALCFYIYKDAKKHKSFYFLLLVVLYSYVALTALFFRMFPHINSEGVLFFAFLYFIVSPIGLILLLINLNKQLKGK